MQTKKDSFFQKMTFFTQKRRKMMKKSLKKSKTMIFSFLQFDDLSHLPIENPSL